MTENNNEDQRPSKMIGVVFPKAKYGVGWLLKHYQRE